MTKEETKSCIGTIEMLQRLAYNIHGVMDVIDADNCKKIIKALEQEPCEDAVSRKNVWSMITGGKYPNENDEQFIDRLVEGLEKMPPVTSQPKTGHWIEGRSDNPNIHNILCSRCFEGYPSKGHANSQHTKEKFKWCPNCGAYMIGESEK